MLWLRRFKRWARRPFRRWRLARTPLLDVSDATLESAFVSIILPTFERLPFLRVGLPALLAATTETRCEVIVWDNASQDGTGDWLAELKDPRLRVLRHPQNIGLNALARGLEEARGDYILQVDDDVLWFPQGFLRTLLRAYLSIPEMGYLGTGVIADRYTDGGRLPRWRSVPVTHRPDLEVDYGAVGGWCTLTDRALYDRVGGFLRLPDERYYWADRDYYRKVGALGRKRGILESLKVYHACRIAPRDADRAAFEAKRRERGPEVPPAPEVREDFWAYFQERIQAVGDDQNPHRGAKQIQPLSQSNLRLTM